MNYLVDFDLGSIQKVSEFQISNLPSLDKNLKLNPICFLIGKQSGTTIILFISMKNEKNKHFKPCF